MPFSKSFKDDSVIEKTLLALLETKKTIWVVHCHYCLERGPTAARLLHRALEKRRINGSQDTTTTKSEFLNEKIQVYILQGGIKTWINHYQDSKFKDFLLENIN